MTDKLTEKQARFVAEYLVDLNATQAAIRAGYSEDTARSQGQRLLTNVNVEAAISAAQKERSERTKITQDRVLQEFAKIGFSDIRALFTESGNLKSITEWSDEIAGAVASVEVVTKPGGEDENGNRIVEHVHKLKLWDKNSALEKIAKHLGMFVERHEHTGPNGGPIKTEQGFDLSNLDATDREALRGILTRRIGESNSGAE